MHVRSGLPLWRAIHLNPVIASPLDGDLRCDVAVLGGGITGALAGYFLAREGVDAILVD